ncbi:hypothetical protein [Corynebacterium sanguinis]|uniref:hypothetical protein n=1 Tax=Corynebacterium sanguinis TaxID=2594913 RepID=UPI00319DE6C1
MWDHESGIGKAKLCEPVAAFGGALGCRIVQTPPRDPESKGIVEREGVRKFVCEALI